MRPIAFDSAVDGTAARRELPVQDHDKNDKSKVWDAIIIGAGPAGINCALELNYCNVECLVLSQEDRLGGQLWEVGELLNFAGGYYKSGSELAQSMKLLVEKTKIKLLLGQKVEQIDCETKTIIAGKETLRARTILLSTGVRLRRIDIAGMTQFAPHIFYRDEKSVSAHAGLRVAVFGGGDNALMKALDLAQVADNVYLVNRSNRWRARSEFLADAKQNSRIEIIENTYLQSLDGTDSLQSACLVDTQSQSERTIQITKLFIKVGYTPNTEIFQEQIVMDAHGYLLVNKNRETNIAGIFAAGDVIAGTSPRVATACGDGVTAAESIQFHLGRRL